jgi:3-oxoacyl-[acyl-carrier-protein] synthase-3
MYAGGEKEGGQFRGWASYSPEEREKNSILAIKQDVRLLNEKVIHYTVERTLSDILLKRQIHVAEIDYFLPHYSSEFFREKVYQGLKNIGFEIPYEKWFTNLTSKGNTGSASIFIMLEELFHSGRLMKDEKILCYIPESGRFSSAFMLLTVV